MNTIAIDCGASFIKGALINDAGIIVTRQQKQAPAVDGGQNVMKPVQINTLFLMVEKMIEELADNEREVKLCISNEMHGFMLAFEDGTPYTDYISWQKEYGSVRFNGETAVNILNSKEYSEDIKKSGMPLRSGLPSCNLLYLRRLGYVDNVKGKLYFYTLGDYIIRRFADIQPICHPSNMAATGLYNLKKNDWNEDFIHEVCGKNVVFPAKTPEENVISIDRKGVRYYFYPAVGDQQAALLGAGLEDLNSLSFNLGTGAQVSVLTKEAVFERGYQIRPYFGERYIKTIPHLPSGRALNVYIRFFEDVFKQFGFSVEREEIWRVLLNASDRTEKSDLICDLSFFENAVTEHIMGSIANIGEFDLGVGTLFNSIFEQMIKNFIWAADKVQPDREKVKRIIFSGGIARKIEKIRDGISAHYLSGTKINVADDETLIGLYKYGNGGAKV